MQGFAVLCVTTPPSGRPAAIVWFSIAGTSGISLDLLDGSALIAGRAGVGKGPLSIAGSADGGQLITCFSRYYMKGRQRDMVEDRVTREMLDRNPERFALLMGKKRLGGIGEIRCRHSRFA